MYDELPASHYSRSVFVLLALAVVLSLTLGKPLLASLGLPYSTPGGAFISKLHPSTYVTMLALFVAVFRRGSPLSFFVQRLIDRRPVMLYLVIVGLISAVLFLRSGAAGLAYIVDTLMVPALLALLLTEVSPANRARLFGLVVLLVLADGLIAIGESATRTLIIEPLIDLGREFRATALLGHPLNSSLISAPVILFATGFGRLSAGRLAAVLVLAAALMAFGGRAAAALAVVFLAVMLGTVVIRQLVRGRMPLQSLIAIPLILLIVPLAVSALWLTTDIAERLQNRLFFGPSAQARINLFNVFHFVTAKELWFGVSSRSVADLTEFIPNSNTIENFWVFMIVQMGIAMFVPYVAGMLAFLTHLYRRTTSTGRFAIALFMLVASTNNSLTSKTPALAVLVVLVVCAGDFEWRLAARRQPVPTDDLALGTP